MAKKDVKEWIIALLIMLFVLIIIRTFIMQVTVVSGYSMEPTLEHEDKVITSKLSYILSEPDYNDIIVFSVKNTTEGRLIKRIIGKPGDEIDMISYKFVVNGEILENDFSEEIISAVGDIEFPIVVPENSYFVLGDNRNASRDSRYASIGCVSKKDIIGKAVFRILPMRKIGSLGE